MTSNQIEYWKNEEIKRTNQAQEYERNRHNVQEEAARLKELGLRNRELNLQQQMNLQKLAEMYAKYGFSDMQNIPVDIAYQLGGEYGYQPYDIDPRSAWPMIWHEIKSSAGSIGKLIGSIAG